MKNKNWQDINTIPHNKRVLVLLECASKYYLAFAKYVTAFTEVATDDQVDNCMAEYKEDENEHYLIEGLYESGQTAGLCLFDDMLSPISWAVINEFFPEVES